MPLNENVLQSEYCQKPKAPNGERSKIDKKNKDEPSANVSTCAFSRRTGAMTPVSVYTPSKKKNALLTIRDDRPIFRKSESKTNHKGVSEMMASGGTCMSTYVLPPAAREALATQSRISKAIAKSKAKEKKEATRKIDLQMEKTAEAVTSERVNYEKLIERHYNVIKAGVHKIRYKKREFEVVIEEASTVFSSEKALLDLDPPCVVVGDLHGQFNDLINMFLLIGRPPHVKYVFTGDYVDRGMMSIECIMLLFSYKVCYPEGIYLLRGNHEIARVNKKYGFYDECLNHIPNGEEIWALFQRCFNQLPIAALVATKILCMHGGLSPSLTTLDILRDHPKPIRNPFRGLVNDMLWADPDLAVHEWKTSSRGSGFAFGTNVIDEVCHRLGIELIIRAHQMCFDGYWVVPSHKLITIFSAPLYCNLYKNAACVLKIDDKLEVQIAAFVPESPNIEQIIQQKQQLWDPTIDKLDPV
ncbi:unnamed protein product [Caenorhabditis auriculariae]|uniref:Serine/threonine-protein phosphatase n=1 Tax=Caenorhabditis auriculariae TaxID=2777116 RepID=A0A8S1GYR0_9PELO|nr:unnamed protein product [Caenorhabditis auriculariae]